MALKQLVISVIDLFLSAVRSSSGSGSGSGSLTQSDLAAFSQKQQDLGGSSSVQASCDSLRSHEPETDVFKHVILVADCLRPLGLRYLVPLTDPQN